MKGRGAPRPNVFGLMGDTMDSPYNRSLGGLIIDTKVGANKPGTTMKYMMPPTKTRIPGAHYGQVPYPGYFMGTLGKML
jgi:hypothetical protein